jgi:hypothetical protein
MVYVAYESSNILTFFNEYIQTGTFENASFSLSSSYINIYMFIISIVIAAVALIIYILMRQKNKPKLLYLIIIGFYLGINVYFFQVYNVLDVLEVSAISPRSLRVIRDVSSIVCFIQYFIVLLILIRAVGFNIKKFNFGEDLAELKIDVSDNEEFELTVGVNSNKIGRHLRRGRREFKYFVKENAFILSLISTIIIISTSVIIFLNNEVYNKLYDQGESFKANYFTSTINNCYYTHTNQRGASIAKTGKMFAVISITLNNKDESSHVLDLNDISLVSNEDIYAPNANIYDSFLDLGIGYTNKEIKSGEQSTYIFVFEIDEKTNLDNLVFRYREGLKFSSTRLEAKYKNVKLEGITLDTIRTIDEVNKGEELTFTSSSLNNTKLKINSIDIQSGFKYNATVCINNACSISENYLTLQYTSANKSLMKLTFDYNKDSTINITNGDDLAEIVKYYGFIRYYINNKTYSSELINKTPTDYNGDDLYYQVPTDIVNATKVELIFRIRNKDFIYNLK